MCRYAEGETEKILGRYAPCREPEKVLYDVYMGTLDNYCVRIMSL